MYAAQLESVRPESDTYLEREIERIESVLRERGPLARNELAALVGARGWGPGRFRRALSSAVLDGRIRRTGRRFEATHRRDQAA